MNHDLTLMIDNNVIQSRVSKFGNQLNQKYSSGNLIIICILKGAVPFLKDLASSLKIDYDIQYLDVKSYKGTKREKITSDEIKFNCENKDILIIDDICDTGNTLIHVINLLNKHNPKEINTAVLLNKQIKFKEYKANTSLFDISDEFVVGYGLDYNNKYRFLNNIYILN